MYFSNKTRKSNFIEQHSETVMVANYQNADCSLKNKFVVLLIIICGTLSFPVGSCTGLLLWARLPGDIDRLLHGRWAGVQQQPRRSTALSGKCGQCHVIS